MATDKNEVKEAPKPKVSEATPEPPTKEEKLWTAIDAVRAVHPSGGDWPDVVANALEALAPSRPAKPKGEKELKEEHPLFIEGFNEGLKAGPEVKPLEPPKPTDQELSDAKAKAEADAKAQTRR